MRVFAVLLCFAALSAAVSLETVTLNGSTYYWTENNGTISPYVLINASSKVQFSTADTNDIEDALSRQSWLKYAIGFGRLQTPNQLRGITATELPTFNAYAFTDNATYWRAIFNKTITMPNGRHALVALSYEQGNYDDYVNMTIRYDMLDGTYNSLSDIYYALEIRNITEFDRINIYHNDSIYDHLINGSFNYTNVSAVVLYRNGLPYTWKYLTEEGQANQIFVYQGRVWIAYNLGRTLAGGFQRSLYSIDAEECLISCNPGARVTYYVATENATNLQVPFNTSVIVQATDSGGDCTITTECLWTAKASHIYTSSAFSLAYQDVNNSANLSGSNWLRCNNEHPNARCDLNAGSGIKKIGFYCPLEEYCTYQVTVQGNYTGYIISWAHLLRTLFNGVVRATETYRPKDDLAPQLYCPFANNSVVDVPATNNSLAWANLSIKCNASGPGLVNNSGKTFNGTGSRVLYVADEVDNDSAVITLNFTVAQNKRYESCVYANSTNYVAGTRGSNWTTATCFHFGVNIVQPLATPPAVQSVLLSFGEDDDELADLGYRKFNIPPLLILLAALFVLGGAFVVKRK